MLGLRAIHGKGIAHRDMKGSNVFIKKRTEGGEIYKIGDFGLAIQGRDSFQSYVGSGFYIAPEIGY